MGERLATDRRGRAVEGSRARAVGSSKLTCPAASSVGGVAGADVVELLVPDVFLGDPHRRRLPTVWVTICGPPQTMAARPCHGWLVAATAPTRPRAPGRRDRRRRLRVVEPRPAPASPRNHSRWYRSQGRRVPVEQVHLGCGRPACHSRSIWSTTALSGRARCRPPPGPGHAAISSGRVSWSPTAAPRRTLSPGDDRADERPAQLAAVDGLHVSSMEPSSRGALAGLE